MNKLHMIFIINLLHAKFVMLWLDDNFYKKNSNSILELFFKN
jgi:hypothetical protein